MGEILKDLKNKKYGPVFESIKLIPVQFKSALNRQLLIPQSYKNNIKNVVLCGMGGSALGAHIFKALDKSKVPFLFYNGYVPPRFLGKDTLFIASSYSGNTEEVLSSLDFAIKAKAKIIGIGSGGKLEKKISGRYPFLKFDDSFNPSGQPRYALGYGLGALFNIFLQLNLAEYKMKYLDEVARNLKAPSVSKAQKLAKELKGFMPIIVASEFLEGVAHTFVNQLNETAKVFSEAHSIPELNHHLMEGLKRPEAVKKLKFLFLESNRYLPKNKKRYQVTQEVVKKNKIDYNIYRVSGKRRMEQALNLLMALSLASLALAVIHKEDPTAIPWVKYFKNKM